MQNATACPEPSRMHCARAHRQARSANRMEAGASTADRMEAGASISLDAPSCAPVPPAHPDPQKNAWIGWIWLDLAGSPWISLDAPSCAPVLPDRSDPQKTHGLAGFSWIYLDAPKLRARSPRPPRPSKTLELVGFAWISLDSARHHSSRSALPATKPPFAVSPRLMRIGWIWLDFPGWARLFHFPLLRLDWLDLVGFYVNSPLSGGLCPSGFGVRYLTQRDFRHRMARHILPFGRLRALSTRSASKRHFAFYTFHFSFSEIVVLGKDRSLTHVTSRHSTMMKVFC